MDTPDFLSVAGQYQLGMLDTERPHPKTSALSRWAREDVPHGLAVLREVDREALDVLHSRLESLEPLADAIARTIRDGHRVYLCGCGATGRLSLALEIFARNGLLPGATPENVVGFMAGGDAALIRSIERFEDLPEYGERQLLELGFGEGDLLIASTEGGETPWVIGAAEAAASRSRQAPFFLYCNPDEVLRANVERSRRVLENPAIHKINLAVGPMALSGSTRMQASTVLMAAIGFAMAPHARERFEAWRRWAVEDLDWSWLAEFTEEEAAAYQRGEYVLYEPGPYGITVLTDTTERSPTFTLTPFERDGVNEPVSLAYLHLPEARHGARDAWRRLLQRDPRPLEWGTLQAVSGGEAMMKFDFSREVVAKRAIRTGGAIHHRFQILPENGGIGFRFQELKHRMLVPEDVDFFGEHLTLKLLLNAHSTLIMGRLGRYEDNLMTYVSPNNFKLIDRSIRYARILLERHHGLTPDYETVARQLLEEKTRLQPNEPIVLKTVEALRKM